MIADERHGDTEPRRAIDYLPSFNRYSDRIEEDEEPEENDRSGRAIEEGNRRLDQVLPESQQPAVENEWART